MAPTFTSASTCWIISHHPGPLPAVRRLRYLPQLAEGVATVAALGTLYVCEPRGPRPALSERYAGCVITPVDTSPPTETPYDPVQGRVTVVAASTSSGVIVTPGTGELLWEGFPPLVAVSTGTARPTTR
jgi:hypothetical protein